MCSMHGFCGAVLGRDFKLGWNNGGVERNVERWELRMLAVRRR